MRTFLLVLSFALLAFGCSKPPLPKTASANSSSAGASSEPTAGQRLDQATAEARRGAGDAATTAKVKAALANDVGLKTLNIEVDANGGVVTLKGEVDTLDTKQRAQRAAQSVKGVTWVQNQLSIAPKPG